MDVGVVAPALTQLAATCAGLTPPERYEVDSDRLNFPLDQAHGVPGLPDGIAIMPYERSHASVLKMPCASGKTYTVRRDLRDVAKENLVIVATCNRLFTRATTKDWEALYGEDNVYCYLDGLGNTDDAKAQKNRLKQMCKERKRGVLFISIESFMVLNGVIDPSDVGALLLEETAELAAKMLSGTCPCVRPFRLLRDVARGAGRVLFTDADFEADGETDGRCVRLARYLCPTLPLRIFTMRKTVEHIKRSVKLYFDHPSAEGGANFDAWWALLADYLRKWGREGDASNNRVAVSCGSKKMVKQVCRLARSLGLFWCDYTSETDDHVKNTELGDPETHWVVVGLVAFTQTLCVGVDPKRIQFAAVFVYALPFGCTVRCLLQGALRFGRDADFALRCTTVFLCIQGRPMQGDALARHTDLMRDTSYFERARRMLSDARSWRTLQEDGMASAVAKVGRTLRESVAAGLDAYGGVINNYVTPDDEEIEIAAWALAESLEQREDLYSVVLRGLLRHGWIENGAALDTLAETAFNRLKTPAEDARAVALLNISVGKQLSSLKTEEEQSDWIISLVRAGTVGSVDRFHSDCYGLEEGGFLSAADKLFLRTWGLLRRLPRALVDEVTAKDLVELRQHRDAIQLHALAVCVGSTQLLAHEAVLRAETWGRRSDRHARRVSQAGALTLLDEVARKVMTPDTPSFFVDPGEDQVVLGTARHSVVRALEASRRGEASDEVDALVDDLRDIERRMGLSGGEATLGTLLRRICKAACVNLELEKRMIEIPEADRGAPSNAARRKANTNVVAVTERPQKRAKREEEIVAARFERTRFKGTTADGTSVERDLALEWCVESPFVPGLWASARTWRDAHGDDVRVVLPSELRLQIEEDLGIDEPPPPPPGMGAYTDRPHGNATSSGSLDAAVHNATGETPPDNLVSVEWVPTDRLRNSEWRRMYLHSFCASQVGALFASLDGDHSSSVAENPAFKSAVVLLTRTVDGAEQALMAKEHRRGGLKLNLIGGKREHGESARQTVAREAWEETCGLLSTETQAALQTTARPVLLHHITKAVVFTHELTASDDLDLCERVNAHIAAEGRPPRQTFTPARPPRTAREGYLTRREALPWDRVTQCMDLVATQLALTMDADMRTMLERGRKTLGRLKRDAEGLATDENGIRWKPTHYARRMLIGRLTADASSMQPMPNLFRQWLYRGLLHDVDIENAHPTIMLGLVKLHRPDTYECDAPRLAQYVADRNSALNAIARHYGLPSRDFAKTAILVVMNGGDLRWWRQKVKSPVSPRKPDLPLLLELQREALWVRNTIVFSESAFASQIEPLRKSLRTLPRNRDRSDEQLSRSVFSYVLGHIESMALEAACEVLERNGFVPTSLIFDGCLVTDNPDGDLSTAMRDAELAMEQKLGGLSGLRLKEKDMYQMAPFSLAHTSREAARQAAFDAVAAEER